MNSLPTRRHALAAASLLAMLAIALPARAEPIGGGGFVSCEVDLTWVNGGLGVVVGFSGGYRSPDGFVVGLGLYDLVNGTRVAAQDDLHTKMHWAGVLLGKQWKLDGNWTAGPTVLLGGGDVSHYRDARKDDFDRSWYLLVEPRVGAWSPRAGHFGWDTTAGYRWVPTIWRGGGAVDSLSGPVLSLAGGYGHL